MNDTIAVVTGASRGIGKATALRLAANGLQVVLAARTEQARTGTPGTIHETAEEIRAFGIEPLVVPADLSQQTDVDRLAAATLDRFGGVDVLVNNAAYTVGRTLFTHVPDLTRDQWDKHFAINVTAPLMLMQAFWRSMAERGGGVVVNVTSGAARSQPLSSMRANPAGIPENGPAYGASKAALDRMANVIAAEGAPLGIAVVNVEPGFVLTETMASTLGQEAAAASGGISPDVPAAAITYLCTSGEASRYAGTVVSAPEIVAEKRLL